MESALAAAAKHIAAQRYTVAEMACRQLLEADPGCAEAYCHLAQAAIKQHDTAGAERYIEQALACRPTQKAHAGLARAYELRGDLALAMHQFRQSLGLVPDDADSLLGLARCLYLRTEYDKVLALCLQLLALQPDNAAAHTLRGAALMGRREYSAASDAFAATLGRLPESAVDHNNLGLALSADGKHEQAMRHLRRAIALRPAEWNAHSNLLYVMSHIETMPAATLFDEHTRVGTLLGAGKAVPPHENGRERDRPLRIGFISADLYQHPLSELIEPIWTAWDGAAQQIWVYHNRRVEDATSRRLRALAHQWRHVDQLDDLALAAQIRADRIDILIDLSGHTGHNRLPALAYKPAPVQASWLGYPNTTGLAAIDYYLADRHLAPHGQIDRYFTEKIVRLPALCSFQLRADAPPPNRLPALRNAYFTYASFNRGMKLGEQVIALWSRILLARPGARMLLAPFADDDARNAMRRRFASHGVAAERLSFSPQLDIGDYLALHHQVDLVLDTYPYGGGTTSAHSLTMGVPVLTLAGDSMRSRQTAALLLHAGLGQFVTGSESEYVAAALDWSERWEELDAIRSGLRTFMLAPPPQLAPAAIARQVQQALRIMWQRWCDGVAPAAFDAAA